MLFYICLALVGVLAGMLGGMGMGGGTLLIPLLTIIFNLNQRVVQGINLISFSIMALIIIMVHAKNKLIDFKVVLGFAGLSLLTSIMGALLASIIKVSYLKLCFGLLLVGISIFQAIIELKKYFKRQK